MILFTEKSIFVSVHAHMHTCVCSKGNKGCLLLYWLWLQLRTGVDWSKWETDTEGRLFLLLHIMYSLNV